MPEMDAVLDELRRLPDHPPSPPAPLARVMDRARRRRRRRRAGAALAASLVVVAAAVGVAVAVGGDDGSRVRVAAPPRTAVDTTVPDGLRLDPSTGLRDGQEVTVSGPFDVEDVIGVGQCAAEAGDAPDPLPWCEVLPGAAPSETVLRVDVARSIETSNGVIDCTERPGRCLIGVRTAAGDLLEPISFAADVPTVSSPAVALDRTSVVDGESVGLSVSGLPGGQQVHVAQCIGDAVPQASSEQCDQARTAIYFADGEGRVDAPFLAYSEVRVPDQWVRCEPCVLVVKAQRQPAVAVPVEVRQTGAPRRPQVAIRPGPPHRPGQRVTLVGSGFQAGQGGITIGICGFRTEHPENEVQGDPRYGHTPCGYPEVGFSLVTGADGRFALPDFPLPDEPFGLGLSIDCSARDANCGLAWHPNEGSLPVFVTLFDLVP